MSEFKKDIKTLKERVTKKEVIIATMALATIVVGTTIGVVAYNVNKGGDADAPSKGYSVEVRTEGDGRVSAMSIYEQLTAEYGDLGEFSKDGDKRFTAFVLDASAAGIDDVEVSFSNGELYKEFEEDGEYDETLVVHNKMDDSVSEFGVTIVIDGLELKSTTATTKATTTTKTTSKTTTTTTDTTTSTTETGITTTTAKGETTSPNEAEQAVQTQAPTQRQTQAPQTQAPTQRQTQPKPAQTQPPQTQPKPVQTQPPQTEPAHGGYTGAAAEWYDYAISQGCSPNQADTYVARKNAGVETIIGYPPVETDQEVWWGIWWYNPSNDTWNW